ncbi:unnamed protein product, partial [Brassica oleracea]
VHTELDHFFACEHGFHFLNLNRRQVTFCSYELFSHPLNFFKISSKK